MTPLDDSSSNQQGTRAHVHAQLGLAFHAMDATGLPWLLLRGESDLFRPAGDVDVLVAPAMLPSLDELLQDVGFCRVYAPGHGSHRFYFCYSTESDLWIKLDVVSSIDFGRFQQWETFLAGACLGRRVASGPLWLPAPADQAWLQLLHLVLDKREIVPSRVATALAAADNALQKSPVADFLDETLGAGTAAELLELVRAERFDGVPALAASMTSRWPGAPVSGLRKAARNRLLRLLTPRIGGNGLVVGAVAPDGAGKTTLLHGLRSDCPLPVAYVYMGLWGAGPWDGVLRRIPGGRLCKKLFRIFRGSLLVKYHSSRGRIVLMDRVVYDALLPNSRVGNFMDTLTDALALKVGPQPDMLLVLDVPGEVMFARKGEHSPPVLEGWRNFYLDLADRLPSAEVLDASVPQDVVRRRATRLLWNGVMPQPPSDAGAGAAGTRVLPLHLWALLDWRFLLPVIQPRKLGYGGRLNREELSALRLMDPAAVRVDAGEAGTREDRCDVVMLAEPDLRTFKAAASYVQPGGWMYLRARRSIFSFSRPWTLAGWKRALARNGFTDISIDWHAPSVDRPARIAPAASPAAIRNILSLHRDVRFGRVKALAGHLALTLRLFEAAMPSGSVTGRRKEEQ